MDSPETRHARTADGVRSVHRELKGLPERWRLYRVTGG